MTERGPASANSDPWTCETRYAAWRRAPWPSGPAVASCRERLDRSCRAGPGRRKPPMILGAYPGGLSVRPGQPGRRVRAGLLRDFRSACRRIIKANSAERASGAQLTPGAHADLRSVALTVVTKPAGRGRTSPVGSRDSGYLWPRRCARVVRRGCWPRGTRTAGGGAPTTTSTVVGGGSPPPGWHRRARSIRLRRSASSSSVGGAGLAAGCCSRIWQSMQTM